MAKGNEIENNEFELLLKDKRHKELIDVLKSILSNLSTVNKTDTKTAMESLLVKTSEIPSSIQAIATVIIAKLDELHNKEQEWTFTVKRDSNGYISTVIAKK